ncbi:hypothetical protein [Geodermatophilus chilensis]|uniref:hypothetical protein n=1 Tax=Geodermatophilus chilensis TaxID=2035835 RepID=UPI000C26A95A|nr:hypothetical protein [Geodermatophilus chilensis]
MSLIRGGDGYAWTNDLEDGGEVFVRLDDQGHVVEVFITKQGGEITPTDLRRLPLTRIRAQAASRPDLWLAVRQDPSLGADLYQEAIKAFPFRWIEHAKEQQQEAPAFELSPSSADEGLTDQFLEDVARAYQSATSRGLRPNVALAEQTQVPKRTVEKWVYLARKKGLLPATRPGRVG